MDHLLVFTKYPLPGYAKTRLIPRLGAAGSAIVSRRLSERCIQSVRDYVRGLSDVSIIEVHIYFAGRGATPSAMEEWLGRKAREKFLPQTGVGLGERLSSAVKNSFNAGARKVVVIGTDIPEITADVLTSAFKKLDHDDAVAGPAHDGGYYLLGMTAPYLELFNNIPWSTEQVMSLTKKRAKENSVSLAVLETLRDVDTPDDLDYLSRFMVIPKAVEF